MAIVRVNQTSFEGGEEYDNRLLVAADQEFQIMLRLLSSYFSSRIDGPNYARELKAAAIALSRIRLALSDIQNDSYFVATRTEFMYQVMTSVVFPNPQTDGVPDLQKTDVDFRDFLQSVIALYFKGSVPETVKSAAELVTGGTVTVREAFLEARKPGSGYDISDEFGFEVEVLLPNPGSIDVFLADRNIRILLSIVRPAHTLYRTKYVLRDSYVGQSSQFHPARVSDVMSFALSNYGYEDFRKFTSGVYGVDPGGAKKVRYVVGEGHSDNFIDSLEVTDLLSLTQFKGLSSSVSTSDSIDTGTGTNDSVTVSDSLGLSVQLGISSAITASDMVGMSQYVGKSDSVSITDSAIRDVPTGFQRPLSDSISVTDSTSLTPGVSEADVAVVTDQTGISQYVGKSDAGSVTDQVGLSIVEGLSDGTGSSDEVGLTSFIGASDSAGTSDEVGLTASVGTSDSASVTDSDTEELL